MNQSRTMEILIISGFLGAGKTTLIKHLLASQTQTFGKIALIVNEYGKVGIDGTLLSGRDVDIVELTSGCVCCTIKTDFFKAIQEINERVQPDYLVVEATGIAQPGDILDVLLEPPLSKWCHPRSLVTVVDADFFGARELLGTFYENQIRCADLLILNKADLLEEGPLQKIETLLREMNPRARILVTQYCAVDPSLFFLHSDRDRESLLHGHEDHDTEHNIGFQTFSIEDHRPVHRERLIAFLESLPPTLFRCKGWIRFPGASALRNFTGGRYRIEPIEKPRTTSLTFVGRNCIEAEILSALKQCFIEEPAGPR